MSEARQLIDQHITEAMLQETVEDYLTQFKWRWMHISDRLYKLAAKEGRQDAMRGAKGWFDICAMRGGVCLFIELKTETGTLDPEQRKWRDEVKACQQLCWDWDEFSPLVYYLWRPSDLSSGEIERTLR